MSLEDSVRAKRNESARRFWHKHKYRLTQERREKRQLMTPEEKAKKYARRKERESAQKDLISERRRQYRLKRREIIARQKAESAKRCRAKIVAYQREWNKRNAERSLEYRRSYRWSIRLEMITAYGGQCACCGESEPYFLTIDHIHNDGAKERKNDRRLTGTKLYLSLRRRNWPKDRYQLLCFNCNCAKATLGECPHQRKAKSVA